ncbi:SgcJ/EcaC family oxidoreductase [Nocardia cyriacigeorgica]|uniref:SgcJ/EcaC family oxidoreductase n=1 Tax=Nocardia cyriacigeorgica TaxID=135487 RepID=A0A6P1CZ27_9NOCA|nr:SgcJ/EcaC family oxidoreductase [Nocardia cyriacigeorgica]NEW40127.1 SgcJ/EcaC family oxidoreductase [Nocardia cyriacigeorgica]NEW43386.1 SgcJ/EcaC family oxidoreductase [Nocardia cyriacigeorgica]NEW51547.1 SgcJ/EcaC family oxidoreductase [Nocardia cyriacigeorgica]NEW56594.1 SgcJ/EcaC family oxidoreductase [Nocardia cyriacigeorgica]
MTGNAVRAATETDAGSVDERALRELLTAQCAAWAAGDGSAFAATFTDDADFVSVIGEFIQGRRELASVMQEGFDGFMRGTRLSEPERITLRFPTPDTAVLVTYGVCVLRDGAQVCRPEDLSVQTRTAVRTADGWLFTTFQNTRIVKMGG